MSGFFGRIMNLVRGATESFLKDLERDNPEAVYQAAIEAQSRRLHELQEAITSLSVRRDKMQAEKTRLQGDMASLSDQAVKLAASDEARALQALEQKQALADRLTTLDYEISGIESQLEETKKTLPEVKSAIEKLKAERDEMVVKASAARDRDARDAVADWNASSRDAAEDALSRVRQSIEGREALDRELGGGSPVVTPKVSAKEVARQKAAAELEALKKASGAAAKSPAGSTATPAVAAGAEAEEREAEEVEEDDDADATVPLSGEEPAAKPGVPRRTL